VGTKLAEKIKSIKDQPKKKIDPGKNLSLGIDQGTEKTRYVLFDLIKREVIQWGDLQSGVKKGGKKEADRDSGPREGLASLKTLSRKISKKKLGSVHLNLRHPSVTIGNFEISSENAEESVQLAEAALRRELSFPAEEAQSYFYDTGVQVEGTAEGSEKKAFYQYCAIPKKLIFPVIRPVEDALSIIPTAYHEGYAAEDLSHLLNLSAAQGSVAFINIGRSVTIISVLYQGRLIFERDIPLAGQDLTRSILILYSKDDAARTSRDLDSSEDLKKTCEIPLVEEGDAAVTNQENDDVFQAMEGVLSAWVQDIRLSLQHYDEKFLSKKISKVYLMGGGANLKNLPTYLSRELGIHSEILRVSQESKLFSLNRCPNPGAFCDRFHEYATAFALALSREDARDLVPREYQTNRLEVMLGSLTRVVPFAVVPLLLTWFVFLFFQVRHLEEERGAVTVQQGFSTQIEGPYYEMKQWELFYSKVDGQMMPASHVFKVFSRLIPKNILLTQFSFDREARSLSLEGQVSGDPKKRAVTMTILKDALLGIPHFQNVTVPKLEPVRGQRDSLGRFTLSLKLVKQGEV